MDDEQRTAEQPGTQINVNLENTLILYTDNVLMSANEDGLVLDVCQKLGSTNQLQVVSRFGMSRQHAKKFLKELGNLLAMTEGQLQTGEKKQKN